MAKEVITEVTPEILEGWKAAHGKIFVLEVAEEAMSLDPHLLTLELDEQPKLTGYIQFPDNKVLSYAMQRLPNMLEAGKVIVKNCWLGGDQRLVKEDTYLNSAALQVIELIQIRQGRLKEV
jgi:hypothetical protein